jgi:KDO2-lipid IV(A) lauroyltransferase
MKGFLGYAAVRALVLLMRVLPLRVARAAGAGLAAALFRLLRKPRRVGAQNLRRAFPGWPEARVQATLRAVYRQLGWSLAEVCRLPSLGAEWAARNVDFEGRDHADRPLKRGRGVVALVSHFGNWELLGAVFARVGYAPKVVAFPQSNRRVDALIRANRESTGMKVVYTGHRGTAELLAHLRGGGMAGILADQNAGEGGLRLPFFGRDCSVAKAPAVLARKTGAAIVPVFLLRGPGHRFTVRVLPEVRVERTGDAEKDVLEATRRWLKVQEDFIREHPDQYFWLHRRWKHFE